ncbi:MAG: PKD domain-containing protein [Gemmataceae bacterium]
MTRALLMLLVGSVPALGADPWHLAGWNARAVVEIGKASPEPGCDVCGVQVLTHGRVQADGRDLRVTDAAGKPVPFLVHFLDAPRYALLSFRAENPKGRYFVYFDNPAATRAAEELRDQPTPGVGPPKGAWIPRYGFVLETIERPAGDNPRTVEELTKLIGASKVRHGARFQRRVADGYNSFGPSDNYISLYRGWVRVPKAGKYQFCTVSNEASFSFLDGKELIHWPGRHTVDRGIRGEVNALVDLKEGLHYLEYYHEEVTLEQMAYLGWRPSGDEGPFEPIPETFYTQAHEGAVRAMEGPKGRLVSFEPVLADSAWPAERAEGQFTRCTFAAPAGWPADTRWEWEFGDGQKAEGAKVEHVYLTLGLHSVKLTARQGGMNSSATWPLRLFEIEHVTDQFREGRPKDYLKLTAGYDRNTLSAAALKELAYLHAEAEDPAGAVAVGRIFVRRFEKDADPLMLARVRRLLADCAIQLGEGSLDEAIANYQAAVVKELPATERVEVLGRLIRLVGLERGQADRALAVLDQAEKLARAEKLDEDGRKALRRLVASAGDVRLWQGRRDEAQKLYARAEALLPQVIPPQVRAARIGAYPNSLREYLAAGNYGAALDLVDQWDDLFATDRLNGQTFYWRGKILALRGQPREAVRFLDRAVRLAVGAGFETEARWLLAESLEATGKKDEARQQLARLVASGLRDEFVQKAVEKLKK